MAPEWRRNGTDAAESAVVCIRQMPYAPDDDRGQNRMRFLLTILSAGTLMAGGGMLVSAVGADRTLAQTPATTQDDDATRAPSAWAFDLTAIDGTPLPLRQFAGKVVLLVNTASFCGFTPQYAGLETLQEEFGPRGFTVIGVPSGDFQNQEFGSNREISTFCKTKFGITFPLAEKAHVKGPDALPLYRWAAHNLKEHNVPEWNFHKFLIGRDGRLIAGFPTRVAPENAQLRDAIDAALTSGGTT